MMICSNETWWWNGGVFRWIGWRAEWDEKLRNWEEGYGLLVRCMLCAVWMRPAEKEERMHIDYLASLAPAKPHGAFQGYLYPSAGSFFCLFFRLIKYQSIWSILLSFLWLFFLSRNVLADRMCAWTKMLERKIERGEFHFLWGIFASVILICEGCSV